MKTLYLVPHSHTDIGYSHDPIVAVELHDRFIDRAIRLCEETRDLPEGERFRWTVECFFSALHWWEHRADADRDRLRQCLSRGEIDIGARYLNGTETYSPEDIAWEMEKLSHVRSVTGGALSCAMQNDVNGFPLAFARPLADNKVGAILMGLNTTMGRTPFPRFHAFNWDLNGSGGFQLPSRNTETGAGSSRYFKTMLVWNGRIYNIRPLAKIESLAEALPQSIDSFFVGDAARLGFSMASAVNADNIGPSPILVGQVQQFNRQNDGYRLHIATLSEFMS